MNFLVFGSILLALFGGLVCSQQLTQPLIWPVPAQFTVDESTILNVSYNIKITSNINNPILTSAINRYQSIIQPHNPMIQTPLNGVSSVNINVASTDDTLNSKTDEAYNLTLSTPAGGILLTANTIYGAMRGLETLSQAIVYNFDDGYYETFEFHFVDYPRFEHRGLLLDCSRHFHSVKTLFR